jgi:hypothetical protein
MATSTNTVTLQDVIRKVGDTNERALEYVKSPDPQLVRMARGQREALIADLPAVTAGALLGPAALARHFVASAASGRYRDLFPLWELFRSEPDACRPVLADRPQALAKAREALRTAVLLGLRGHAERVAVDVREAQGLIWQWLREILGAHQYAVAARPAVASALLLREPNLDLPLPDQPNERWLAEAAAAATKAELAPAIDERLAAGVDRLPATVATLQLAHTRYPDGLDRLIDRIDLDSLDAGAVLAWARDHGQVGRLQARAKAELDAAASRDRGETLALWRRWREYGVEVALPEAVKSSSLEGLELGRPETADLIAQLLAEGAAIDPQAALDELAADNRQRAEKAYEAFVCADLAVELPRALEGNPIVKEGSRCAHCLAWTWVRPGHEQRCPRLRRARERGETASVAAAPDEQAATPAATAPDEQAATPAATAPDEQPAVPNGTAAAPGDSASPDPAAPAGSEHPA